MTFKKKAAFDVGNFNILTWEMFLIHQIGGEKKWEITIWEMCRKLLLLAIFNWFVKYQINFVYISIAFEGDCRIFIYV